MTAATSNPMPKAQNSPWGRDVAHQEAEVLAEEAGEQVSGRKIVAITVSCFITALSRFETVER